MRHGQLDSEKARAGMVKKGVETYNEDGQWKSRRHGNQLAFAVGGTKAEQTAKGRDAAKADGVEHTIKKMDGTIGEKNSYGHDPNRPKG
ncbi:DUF2188 domain-containing protein [Corynebacterium variabile]|uniref:DUF2188 domain-containing protein n=1 Tax=Corynebacterium TaxID=1716 RepID=UPI0026479253|nr:DUF2188 domain-containing protein [Corynebacterium sp.]MDN6304482.1 DUF2188 domain-containing protein [Corynebacterium sp.]MDN6354411.1 DUF2188 domain-containing protein [Corynebacterium sp.]MDN6366319.1 DUF2188 domain-containing protein [Corynebacterium sp.]MDN6395075.1 DUF2188 domain-containing protein [Corynebacterium sp.]